ncbi:L1 [Bettongia penicillata papillomavirus 1]|uniref:Major capsid protein L1 n=1 Tax=Bettongia penicillata papillomavirus 1 TaxID=759701 RepID=D6N1C4_9PAPI|nr:L1 [Bettongia penicillata papillomavirus 1]ADG21990.1 L1 [Bettongia penicillata papillomavirus 1]
MALWQPSTNKIYLPPPNPSARILNTEEFVKRTDIYYHAGSDRLLTVGHPYFPVHSKVDIQKVVVPKVSGSQYRVFRVKLPDPNYFAITSPIYNPEKERLVWGVVGMQVGRGQPITVGSSGNPYYNKVKDTENPNNYQLGSKDDRQNVSHDPKQVQLCVIGCTPCIGEHWDRAIACADQVVNEGDCPPIELVNSTIEDGNMCDIGYGAMNFKGLQENRSEVPLDISQDTCKYPDFLKMSNEKYGNSLFFFTRREQLYSRHFWVRGGVEGDDVPKEYFLPGNDDQAQKAIASAVYSATPSGSLVSSDSQIFNRPFWLQRAQGANNGILWQNELFVTVVDNTRNCNFTISVKAEAGEVEKYDKDKFKEYLRHVEEYELSFIVQLCKVPLDPDILAHLNAMDPTILDNWNLGFVPAPSQSLEDTYRYITSLATRCPDRNPPKEKKDPYEGKSFWTVDLTERLSQELDQYPLGRKFIFQTAVRRPVSLKRKSTSRPKTSVAQKKRRSN